MDIDNKGFSQLLLSPLFLFDQVLSTLIPGGLFIVLLALKGNALLRTLWYGAPLGYKTKIAAFMVLAYLAGNLVKLPLNIVTFLRKKEDISQLPENWKNQPPAIRKALIGMVTDGALLATPGLIDRLSVSKAEAGFHLGTGAALLFAAFIPGDGSLRGWEAVLGLAVLAVAIFKARAYSDLTVATVGVGLANVLARMSPQQIQTAAAMLNSLKSGVVPDVTQPAGGESVLPKAQATGEASHSE